MVELRRRGAAVADALSRGREARVTCARGSDLRLGLEGRGAIPDAGELTAPGAFGNLPCGEGFVAPVEGTGEGTLVVDGSIAGVGRVEAPVTLTVRSGHLTESTGTAGATLLELLAPTGRTGPTSPSWGSAPTRRRSSPATSSRTRRSSALPTSPSAPRRRLAARSRSRSISTAWCSSRPWKSTARRSSAAASCSSEMALLGVPNVSEGSDAGPIADLEAASLAARPCSTATPMPTTTAPSSRSLGAQGRCSMRSSGALRRRSRRST